MPSSASSFRVSSSRTNRSSASLPDRRSSKRSVSWPSLCENETTESRTATSIIGVGRSGVPRGFHAALGIDLHVAEGNPASQRPAGHAQLETDKRRSLELGNPGAAVRVEALSEGQSEQRGPKQRRQHEHLPDGLQTGRQDAWPVVPTTSPWPTPLGTYLKRRTTLNAPTARVHDEHDDSMNTKNTC